MGFARHFGKSIKETEHILSDNLRLKLGETTLGLYGTFRVHAHKLGTCINACKNRASFSWTSCAAIRLKKYNYKF